MSNNISDITVNITAEDVVNPAEFGGMCLYNLADSGKGIQIPYTEAYSLDEANTIIDSSDMKDVHNSIVFSTLTKGAVTKAQLNALGDVTFLGSEYTVEDDNKTINGTAYTARVKAIKENNGFTVTINNNKTIGIACIGSSTGKTTTIVIKDSKGVIVLSKNLDSDNGEYVSFTNTTDTTDDYTIYSTSADGASMHIYAIELSSASMAARALKNAASIAFMQENPPEKIGILSCELNNLSDYMSCDWRYLLPIGVNIANFKKLATTIETCGELKILGHYINTGDYESALEYITPMQNYERTFVYVGIKAVENDAYGLDLNQIPTALIAKTSSKPVGSFTYKNQALKGVYADEGITKSQLADYHNHNVNAYVHKAGYDVTSEGKLINGEYIDILDAKDWLITQIKYQLQQVLIINDKIPYDNTGISILENTVVNVLKTAYNNGMIAEDDDGQPLYSVEFAKRSKTKASDREKRQYVEGKFSFDLAGAIHEATVNGTINI